MLSAVFEEIIVLWLVSATINKERQLIFCYRPKVQTQSHPKSDFVYDHIL